MDLQEKINAFVERSESKASRQEAEAFLVARDGRLEGALESYHEYLQRDGMQVTCDMVAPKLANGKCYFTGIHTRNNTDVNTDSMEGAAVIMLVCRLHIPGEIATDDIKAFTYVLDRALEHHKTQQRRVTFIFNMHEFNWVNSDSLLWGELFQYLSKVYPARLCNVFFVNYSWLTSAWLAMTAALFFGDIKDKIIYLPTATTLGEYMEWQDIAPMLEADYPHTSWFESLSSAENSSPKKTAAALTSTNIKDLEKENWVVVEDKTAVPTAEADHDRGAPTNIAAGSSTASIERKFEKTLHITPKKLPLEGDAIPNKSQTTAATPNKPAVTANKPAVTPAKAPVVATPPSSASKSNNNVKEFPEDTSLPPINTNGTLKSLTKDRPSMRNRPPKRLRPTVTDIFGDANDMEEDDGEEEETTASEPEVAPARVTPSKMPLPFGNFDPSQVKLRSVKK